MTFVKWAYLILKLKSQGNSYVTDHKQYVLYWCVTFVYSDMKYHQNRLKHFMLLYLAVIIGCWTVNNLTISLRARKCSQAEYGIIHFYRTSVNIIGMIKIKTVLESSDASATYSDTFVLCKSYCNVVYLCRWYFSCQWNLKGVCLFIWWFFNSVTCQVKTYSNTVMNC